MMNTPRDFFINKASTEKEKEACRLQLMGETLYEKTLTKKDYEEELGADWQVLIDGQD